MFLKYRRLGVHIDVLGCLHQSSLRLSIPYRLEAHTTWYFTYILSYLINRNADDVSATRVSTSVPSSQPWPIRQQQ